MITKQKTTFTPVGVTNTLDFDLTEFKRQKEQLKQVASIQVAEKIQSIKDTLVQIKELVDLSGMVINVRSELINYITEVDELHPDWNSSSYDC